MTITKQITAHNFNTADRVNQKTIKWIVVHYFGALGTAKDVASDFAIYGRGASAHYVVDEANIIQVVEDKDVAWHCGTSKGYFGEARNSTSIGVEMRPKKRNTATLNAEDTDWYFDEQTMRNTADLIRGLMKTYGINTDHVVRHYDVTHKQCPRPFQGADVNSVWGISGDDMWARWKVEYLCNARVVKAPLASIKKIDFAQCAEPTGTIDGYYSQCAVKPDIICNGRFFNTATGEGVFTYIDEGKTILLSQYSTGMGVVGDNALYFGDHAARKDLREFISGYPVLLSSGKAVPIGTVGQGINYPARRTIAARDTDALYIIGIEYPGIAFELAQKWLLVRGMSDAINLDGGGSSRILVGGVSQMKDETWSRPVDSCIAVYLNKGVPVETKYITLTLTTAQIKAFQKYLIAMGYSCGAKGADGSFGANSKSALTAFLNAWSDKLV